MTTPQFDQVDPTALKWQDWAGHNNLTEKFSTAHQIRYQRTLNQTPPQNPHSLYYTSVYEPKVRGARPLLADNPPQFIQSWVAADRMPYQERGYWEGYYMQQGRRKIQPGTERTEARRTPPKPTIRPSYGWYKSPVSSVETKSHFVPQHAKHAQRTVRATTAIAARYKGQPIIPCPLPGLEGGNVKAWGPPPESSLPVRWSAPWNSTTR